MIDEKYPISVEKLTDGVGHEAGGDGDSPAEQEGEAEVAASVSHNDGAEGVEHAEVHSAVDKDADSGDGEATVQALDAVRLQRLDVDVDQAVELALAALALAVVGQPGPSVVEGVDEQQGHGSREPAAGDVGGELPAGAGILRGGEHGLDGVLEGEVERLGGEVTQDVGQVS